MEPLGGCAGRKTLEERIFELAADEDGFTAEDSKTVVSEGYAVPESALQVVVIELKDSVVDDSERPVFETMLHLSEARFNKIFGVDGKKIAQCRIKSFKGKPDTWLGTPTAEQAKGYLEKLDQTGNKEYQLTMLADIDAKGEIKDLVDAQIRKILSDIADGWDKAKPSKPVDIDFFWAMKKLLESEKQDIKTRVLVLKCLSRGQGHFTPGQALEMLDYLCPSNENEEDIVRLLNAIKTGQLGFEDYTKAIDAMFDSLPEVTQQSRALNYLRAFRKMPLYVTIPHDYISDPAGISFLFPGPLEKISKEELEKEKGYYLRLFQDSNDKQVKFVAAAIGLYMYTNGHYKVLVPDAVSEFRGKSAPKDMDILIEAAIYFVDDEMCFPSNLADDDFSRRLAFFGVVTRLTGSYNNVKNERGEWSKAVGTGRPLQQVLKRNPNDKIARYLQAILDDSVDIKTALATLHEMIETPVDFSGTEDMRDPQRVAGIMAAWFLLEKHKDYVGLKDEILYLRRWIGVESEDVAENAVWNYIGGVRGLDGNYALPPDEAEGLRNKIFKNRGFLESYKQLATAGLIPDQDVILAFGQFLPHPTSDPETLDNWATMLARVKIPTDLAKRVVVKLKSEKFDFNKQGEDVPIKERIKTKQGLTNADF